jgi:chromosome segregation ATPase
MTALTLEELEEWGGQVRYLLAHEDGYLEHEKQLEHVLDAARAHITNTNGERDGQSLEAIQRLEAELELTGKDMERYVDLADALDDENEKLQATIARLEAEKADIEQHWSDDVKTMESLADTITALQSERDRLREALEKIASFYAAVPAEVASAALAGKD